MKKNTVLALAILGATFGYAQQRECATMEVLQKSLDENPQYQKNMDDIERQTELFIKQGMDDKADIVIPVVVHVIYNNSTENISEAQINAQITSLNKDFMGTNSDKTNRWPQAANGTGISFCLAKVDPQGKSTSGITRTYTSQTYFTAGNVMKYDDYGKSAWPTDQYLNMWVCDLSNGLLGYAQFPGTGSYAEDGVVMDYESFGSGGTAKYPFNKGRTTTHEVGHWLNLRHIWGDGGCSYDDYVSDTPIAGAPHYNCAQVASCGTNDMIENFMDYSSDVCMSIFTNGQASRMRAVLTGNGFRRKLATSKGCSGTTTTPVPDQGCVNVGVRISLDNYGSETTWRLKDASGKLIASGGPYSNGIPGQNQDKILCLPVGCYSFEISDSYGDGICCSYGNGYYQIFSGTGGTLTWGYPTTAYEKKTFCVSAKSGVVTDEEVDQEIATTELYPNPTNSMLNVTFIDLKEELVDVKVMNLMGAVMLQRSYSASVGENKMELDVRELKEGGYFVQLLYPDGRREVKRFVKTN